MLEVTAVFGYTDAEAMERMRSLLPDQLAEIRSYGKKVTVTARYDERDAAPAILSEGAFAALRQVIEAAEIATLGTPREYSLAVKNINQP